MSCFGPLHGRQPDGCLNACVWFETLTGKSCIGNTWRPTEYQLDPALIPVLQEAAHEIVGATG